MRDVRYAVQWKGGERGGWARMRLCEPNPGADVAGYTPASSSFTCWMIESISDGLFSPKYFRGFAIACNMQRPTCKMQDTGRYKRLRGTYKETIAFTMPYITAYNHATELFRRNALRGFDVARSINATNACVAGCAL